MIYIFSREINSRKTSELLKFQKKFLKKIKLCSILSPKKKLKNKRVYYVCFNGIKISKAVEVDGKKIAFYQPVFDLVYNIIKKNEFDFYLIDEWGPIEFKKYGFYKSVKYLLKEKKDFLICVRKELLKDFLSFLKIKEYAIIENLNSEYKKIKCLK